MIAPPLPRVVAGPLDPSRARRGITAAGVVRAPGAAAGVVLVRALPHAGASARAGAPAAVHLALLGAVAVLCAALDVAGHGITAGTALLAVAAAGAALLRNGLARPLVDLRRSVVRATEDPACPLPHSRLADLARLRRAVLVLQGRGPGRARWCYWPATAVVAGAVVPVLVWSLVIASAAPPLRVDTAAVSAATQEGTRMAARVAGILDTGMRDLLRAGSTGLTTLTGPDARFAGIRTWSPDGSAGPAFGRPVATGPPGEYGLALDTVDGRPVPIATVAAADGTPVAGEFDLRGLLARLHRPDVRVAVLDRDLRTVLDTSGFVAFAPATEPALTAVAGRRPVLDGADVVSAAPLRSGPAATLGWTVLITQPAAALLPAGTDTGRPARLAALLAALVALGTGAVHLVWHVGPLRRAGRLATAIVAGDRSTVVVPERHDDVGAVLMCLDLLRRTDGGPTC